MISIKSGLKVLDFSVGDLIYYVNGYNKSRTYCVVKEIRPRTGGTKLKLWGVWTDDKDYALITHSKNYCHMPPEDCFIERPNKISDWKTHMEALR